MLSDYDKILIKPGDTVEKIEHAIPFRFNGENFYTFPLMYSARFLLTGVIVDAPGYIAFNVGSHMYFSAYIDGAKTLDTPVFVDRAMNFSIVLDTLNNDWPTRPASGYIFGKLYRDIK